MTSLRSHEGWMYIDNRNNPGVDDATMVRMGYEPGAGRGLYESATYTCNHCNAVVVIEPKRTRERGFCRKCSHKICDACATIMAQTFECKTMAQVIDETLESVEKQAETAQPSILLLP